MCVCACVFWAPADHASTEQDFYWRHFYVFRCSLICTDNRLPVKVSRTCGGPDGVEVRHLVRIGTCHSVGQLLCEVNTPVLTHAACFVTPNPFTRCIFFSSFCFVFWSKLWNQWKIQDQSQNSRWICWVNHSLSACCGSILFNFLMIPWSMIVVELPNTFRED